MRGFCWPTFVAVLVAIVSVQDVAVTAQSSLHILHQYCQCVQHKHRTVFWVDAYDGNTILYYDPDNKTFVASQPAAQSLVDERNDNTRFIASIPQQVGSLCDRIKALAISTNATQERKAPTYTRAFTQKKLGRTYLVCTAKNFFPRDIKVSWVRNGEAADHGSDTTDIVPQVDGTFQVRSVRPLNGDSSAYACQVEHEAMGEKLLIPLEHNVSVANEALIIIGAVLGILGICATVVTAILYYCLLKGSTQLGPHPTAKFTNQAGLCRMSTCTASMRSTESNTSKSSGSSADGLTKSST